MNDKWPIGKGARVGNVYEARGEICVLKIGHKNSVLECFIDSSEIDRVMDIGATWSAMWSPHSLTYYCRTAIYDNGKKTAVLLHRFLMNEHDPLVHIDHFDHNGLNNIKSNLRRSDHSSNGMNRKGANFNSYTGIRGVSWSADRSKWIAQVTAKRIVVLWPHARVPRPHTEKTLEVIAE